MKLSGRDVPRVRPYNTGHYSSINAVFPWVNYRACLIQPRSSTCAAVSEKDDYEYLITDEGCHSGPNEPPGCVSIAIHCLLQGIYGFAISNWRVEYVVRPSASII